MDEDRYQDILKFIVYPVLSFTWGYFWCLWVNRGSKQEKRGR